MTATVLAPEALLKPIVFARPVRLAPPVDWVSHIPFAFWLVDALRPRSIVEVGRLPGNSYAAFLQAVQLLGIDVRCQAFTAPGAVDGPDFDARFDDWHTFHDRHFGALSRLARFGAEADADTVGEGSVDLLHLDLPGGYETVREAYERWRPKVSARGVLLLHDVNRREAQAGAGGLWDELSAAHPGFAFSHGRGLAVVGLGDALPPAVAQLFDELTSAPRDAVLVRQFFAALGTALVSLPEASAARTEITALQGREEAARGALDRVQAALAEARETEASASSRAAALAADIASRDARIADLAAHIAGQDARIAGLTTQVAQLAAERAESDRARDQLALRHSQLEAAQSRLQAELSQWQAHAERAARELEAREADLQRARARVAAQHQQRREALGRVEAQVERWRLIAFRRSARSGTATLRTARTLAGDVARRVRHGRRLPPGATPVLTALVSPRFRRAAATIRASGLFDARFYLGQNPDVAESHLDPLVHFVALGGREGRSPHPLFDAQSYLDQLRPATVGNALQHYLEHGWREGRVPHALFDSAFYRRQDPALADERVEPLRHYLEVGAAEGLDPHPLFDTSFYVAQNADVAASGVNPLVHFVEFGWREGRRPHPLFDPAFYLECYVDVDEAGLNPLVHFVTLGAAEGRQPNPWFDTAAYLAADEDLRASGENPLVHFLRVGAAERRPPSAAFDIDYYGRANPDAAACGLDPLSHYVLIGHREGRPIQPPPPPIEPGNAEASAAAYRRVAGGARDAEMDRIAALDLPAPEIIRVPEGADLREWSARVELREQTDPDVSVVVPVMNAVRFTLECLLALSTFDDDRRIEVIVVDNGSSDETPELLSGIPHLRYLRYERNQGFVGACNAGAAVARGRFLVLLNNDAQVTPGWLTALLEPFERGEPIGAVGPKVIYPNGRLQEAGSNLLTDGASQLIGLHDDPRLPQFDWAREVDYVSGVCLAIETARFRELGGLADAFAPAYCEDVDLCLRLREQGLRLLYQPASVVVHHLSVTSNQVSSSFKHVSVTRNQQLLAERHQARIDAMNATRVIGFYLPQFHPIPENDVWWGKGFTEWRNVAKARPNFQGHYQPRLAGDLGYYDLRLRDIYRQQVALAQRYGVTGFCFYYYWFGGKRLLEGPIERLVAEADSTFPFCLCWANENWTRQWDGRENEILVGQSYGDEDVVAVIRDLIRYMRQPSYLRIGARPLLLVYHASRFPDPARTTATWREECRRAGLGEIYLAMVESFELSQSRVDPAEWGFDAAVEFPPHEGGLFPAAPGRLLNPEFKGLVFDYEKTAMHYMTRPQPGFRRFPGVMPGWDNTPRRQDDAVVFVNSTPGAYQAWLERALRRTREQNAGEEQLVFVNAWNEWAEGTYLEPDLSWGHAYLEATRDAIDNVFLGLGSPRS